MRVLASMHADAKTRSPAGFVTFCPRGPHQEKGHWRIQHSTDLHSNIQRNMGMWSTGRREKKRREKRGKRETREERREITEERREKREERKREMNKYVHMICL